ncbi:hypothetical protein LJC18_04090 [Lachnospiraceae bacterium OttesenSCG-928-E19]|nr:hypothetical protein [Lachnospiraceae bacterium OttesenSCG-928-E19]
MKPVDYLKISKAEFKNLPVDICDDMLSKADKGHMGGHMLMIGNAVSNKYHGRMQKVWLLMVFNILFNNTSRQYTMQQKHNILKKYSVGNERYR